MKLNGKIETGYYESKEINLMHFVDIGNNKTFAIYLDIDSYREEAKVHYEKSVRIHIRVWLDKDTLILFNQKHRMKEAEAHALFKAITEIQEVTPNILLDMGFVYDTEEDKELGNSLDWK